MIKAMAAPYTQMKFMPTGGINAKNINSYLAFDKILACGGSWMVKKDLVAAGEFDKIRDLTKEAVQTMLGFELAHIGINCENEEQADQTASAFDGLFGFTKKSGNSSVFAGTAVECMKAPGLGAKGHIAVSTNSVARAKNYLEMMGYKFKEETAKFKGDKLTAIYLEDEIGGFASTFSSEVKENFIMAKRVITFGEIMLRLAPEGYYRFVQGQQLWRHLRRRRSQRGCFPGKLWHGRRFCYKASEA